MTKGIGVDIVDIRRIEKALLKENFKSRILNESEIQLFRKSESIAGVFAAKEAASKALGLGFARGISFLDFEVLKDEAGKPFMALSGKAMQRFIDISARNILISIAHEKDYAICYCIIE